MHLLNPLREAVIERAHRDGIAPDVTVAAETVLPVTGQLGTGFAYGSDVRAPHGLVEAPPDGLEIAFLECPEGEERVLGVSGVFQERLIVFAEKPFCDGGKGAESDLLDVHADVRVRNAEQRIVARMGKIERAGIGQAGLAEAVSADAVRGIPEHGAEQQTARKIPQRALPVYTGEHATPALRRKLIDKRIKPRGEGPCIDGIERDHAA